MNIVKQINQYDDKCIYLCEPIKNNIIENGHFIRIIYSTHNVVFNGIYLLLSFSEISCDKYFNKHKYSFNVYTNFDLIYQIQKIEQQTLKKHEILNKTPKFKLYEQIKSGNIKIFGEPDDNTNILLILKISGIWETDNAYGLTFKFINCASQ